jgi:hypothetical protein
MAGLRTFKDGWSEMYNACNDKYNMHVTGYIYHIYSHWPRCMYKMYVQDVCTRCMYKIHVSEYYNVKLHKFIWINGTALNQLEEVKPEVTVMDFCYLLYRLYLVDKEQARTCETFCVRHDASEYGRCTTNKLCFQLLYYFYIDLCHLPILYLLKII